MSNSDEVMAAAVLFDMDGVLVNSIESDENKWRQWASARGMDPVEVARSAHGIPTQDYVAKIRPDLDAAEEARLITEMDINAAPASKPIPGSNRFVASLPTDRWAVFTSATEPVAIARLAAVDIHPSLLVTADDVRHGKPAPDGYLLAAHKLGVPITECIVIEDAPIGIAAAHAAGARVLGLMTSHDPRDLTADWLRESLANVTASTSAQGLTLQI